jgi:hypothetical protein
MITCPRCGAATAPGKFCAQCGAPLQTPVLTHPARQRPAWLTAGLVVGGAALLALVGWGGYALLEGGTPTRSYAPATSAPSAKPALQPATQTAAKPGRVTGAVTDAAGAPLKLQRSQVVVQVTGDLNDGKAYKGNQQLDSNWRYSAEVPPGKYTASGFVKVNFQGKEFWLSLDPVGGRALQDSAKGVVKDLQWKLTGLRPDSDRANPYSYYGSFVFMLYQGRTLPDAAKVTFTMTPLTALADGSQGKPLTFQATGQELKKGKNLMDMPLARYRITGEVTMPDGSRKQALISGATGSPAKAQEFIFTPNSMGEGMEGVSLWMMGES